MKLDSVEFVASADRFFANSWGNENFMRRWRKLSPCEQALLTNHQDWKNGTEIDLGAYYAQIDQRSAFSREARLQVAQHEARI